MASKKKDTVNPVEEFFKSFAESDSEVDFSFGNDVFTEKLDVIPTSSLVLDDALSSGGLPKGRLLQYYGPPASGKTFMTILAIKQAQKADPEAYQMFYDAEQAFDKTWALRLGVNLNKLGIVEGRAAYSGQRLFESLLGVPKEDKKHRYAGKSKEGLLDKIANGQINVNLIIIDSLGQIDPPGLENAAIGQVTMGKKAKFLSEVCPKLAVEVKKANVPLIMINHKRDSLDLYGPDHTFTGGNSYAHSLSANIYFESVARKDATLFDEDENKVGGLIRATVEKSKFGPHPRKCEFMVDYRVGVINEHVQIADLAIKYNVVNKPNNVMYEYNDLKWKGRSAFDEAIRTDTTLASVLLKEVEGIREAERVREYKEKEELQAAIEGEAGEIETDEVEE